MMPFQRQVLFTAAAIIIHDCGNVHSLGISVDDIAELADELWKPHFLSKFLAAYQAVTEAEDPQTLLQLTEAKGLDDALVGAAVEWTREHPAVPIERREAQVMQWMIINGLRPAHLEAEDLHELRVNMLVDSISLGDEKETVRSRLITSKVRPEFQRRVLDLYSVDARFRSLLLQPTLFSELHAIDAVTGEYPVPITTYLTESLAGRVSDDIPQAVANPHFDHPRACQENKLLVGGEGKMKQYVAKGLSHSK